MKLRARLLLSAASLAAALAVSPALVPSTVMGANPAGPNTYTPYKVGINGGEPSIGFDPNANVAVYGSGLHVVRMKWDDTKTPATVTNTDVTPVTGGITTLDAITVVDQQFHRTFNTQLAAVTALGSVSDDGGLTWTPAPLGSGVGTVLDHESVGAGPFHAPIPPGALNEAVYYCAQNSFNGGCAVSLDGGLTYGPGVPAYNTPANNPGDPTGGACSALHGHLRVGPDGTAYLPIKGCGGTPTVCNLTNTEFMGGHPSVSVSEDNGTTWLVHSQNEGTNRDESDNSIGIGADNKLYMGWENGTNQDCQISGPLSQAMISTSTDHGKTWTTPVDVSSPLGLKNVQFPEVIAGDNDRAAFAFLGTNVAGDDQQNGFIADWHLYISTTYDGGRTYTTVDTTPVKPMQKGCIDNQGIAPGSPKNNVCSQRNLLDFNDITLDREGRVLAAYSDGCTDQTGNKCATDPTVKTSKGAVDMVMRQSTGRGLYAKYDGVIPGSGDAVTVTGAGSGSNLGGTPNTSTAGAVRYIPAALLVLAAAGLLAVTGRRRRV